MHYICKKLSFKIQGKLQNSSVAKTAYVKSSLTLNTSKVKQTDRNVKMTLSDKLEDPPRGRGGILFAESSKQFQLVVMICNCKQLWAHPAKIN